LSLRLRSHRTRAVLVALALAIGAGTAHAQSDTELPSLLTMRRSIPATPARAADETVPGTIPYASPPGSGASVTGFISATTPAQRAAKRRRAIAKRTAKPAPAPATTGRALPVRPIADPLITDAIPTPRRSPRPIELEPYAPAGVTLGAFTLRSIVDLWAGYDSNALRTPGGPASRFTVVEPQFAARSNWARHELTADLRGAYTAYQDVTGNDRPEAHAAMRGRIDVTSLTKVELEGRASLTTESPGSPDAVASVVRPPNIYNFGATAGFVQRFNRFEVGLRALIDTYRYENAELTNGMMVDLADREYVAHGLRLRGSYELSPGVKPFVETGVDRRVFDLPVDFTGVMRGSHGWFARAGFAFERRGFLTGEISAGYMARSYRDPTLPNIAGFIFDSSLIWNASALTRLILAARSTIDETMVPGASGLFRHEARLTLEHEFRRYFIGMASIGYALEDYIGATIDDRRLRASVGMLYYLNRSLAARAEFRHERLHSNVAGQDYTANIALVGLRLQR
jgi:hypothetical protein